MDRLKKFIDIVVPVTTCNLRCHYCYVTHNRVFDSALPKFCFSPDFFRKALSVKRLGGICMMNFCGCGETLLPPETPSYVRAILEEGHYAMVVTNGTVDRAFDEFEKFPKELLDRLFFKFSYHYLQLHEHNLTNKFFRNVKRMRDAGASFTIEATPSDELIPYIQEMKDETMREVGAWCHITTPRNERDYSQIPLLSKMSMDEFGKTWKVFDSPFFDYKFSLFGKKRTEFCYAGLWSFILDMGSGCIVQCNCSLQNQNIYKNIEAPVSLNPIGHYCRLPHCFNAHAFLTFGDIPVRDDPSYAVMRNRICNDGTEWLKPKMKAFMSQFLKDNNHELSEIKKMWCDVNMCTRMTYCNLMNIACRFYHKICRIIAHA